MLQIVKGNFIAPWSMEVCYCHSFTWNASITHVCVITWSIFVTYVSVFNALQHNWNVVLLWIWSQCKSFLRDTDIEEVTSTHNLLHTQNGATQQCNSVFELQQLSSGHKNVHNDTSLRRFASFLLALHSLLHFLRYAFPFPWILFI